MTNYRHNWRDGYHPFLAVPGGSGIRPWGMDVPALGPVQGGGAWAPCQTQVIEWPWADDEAGVAFDQDNLWGVRTRCWSTDDIGDPGDRDWWVAVPKVLDGDYTPRGRSHVQPMIYDHLGDDPFQGVVEVDGFGYSTRPVRWRTPTGRYPTDLMDNGYLWVPMNLNQRVTDYGFYIFSPDGEGWDSQIVAPISVSGTSPTTGLPYNVTSSGQGTTAFKLNGHIGFRAVSVRMVFRGSGFSSAYPPDFKYIGNVRVGYSASEKSAPDEPDTITGTFDFTEADLVSQGWDGSAWVYTLDVDLGESLAPLGERQDFMVLYTQQSCGMPSEPLLWNSSHLYWSPRTDVPLWYWASQRNRVAPGGVILP